MVLNFNKRHGNGGVSNSLPGCFGFESAALLLCVSALNCSKADNSFSLQRSDKVPSSIKYHPFLTKSLKSGIFPENSTT